MKLETILVSREIGSYGPQKHKQHLPNAVESFAQYRELQRATGTTRNGRILAKKDDFLEKPL
jgi:hypothetical protein